MRTAIAIIGGGILGSVLAGFLAEAGEEVTLIDGGGPGGSSANAGSLHVQMQSRFMRLYPEHVPGMERQLPLYPRAVRFWKALEEKLGADFDLKMKGGLMVAESADQLDFLRRKADREAELGLSVEILDRAALDRIAPYLGPAVVGAELCHDEGKLNPLKCNDAIRAWLRRLGVRLLEGVTVRSVSAPGGGRADFTLDLAEGAPLTAGRVVLAAGAASGGLAAAMGLSVPTRAEPLHMNITEATAPMIGHLVQHADRMITLKQFSTGQIVIGGGWPADLAGPRAHPTVRLDSLIANTTLALHSAPSIAPLRIIRTWAGVNTSVDGKGVLGASTVVPRLFFAIPGDAGYTLGPLSARFVADMMLHGDAGEDLGDYSPIRFAA